MALGPRQRRSRAWGRGSAARRSGGRRPQTRPAARRCRGSDGPSAGCAAPHGHEHHLNTINKVRRLGGIKQAVESGMIKDGIMASCIRQNVDMVLAGSIRDDGPLPDVVTDTIKAQDTMRAALTDVGLALMVATTLHSIATGNCLPAKVPSVCVDINPAVLTKLSDRGSFQAVGLVMDSSSFLKELARELNWSG